MSKESFENNTFNIKIMEVEKATNHFEGNYQHYRELGGVINEGDYTRTLKRANDPNAVDKHNFKLKSTIIRGENIADHAKISLYSVNDNLDPKIVLYVLLRTDTHPLDIRYHHSQMGDQNIFAEAVRMLGDADSLNKLITAYPNISFNYNNVQLDEPLEIKKVT